MLHREKAILPDVRVFSVAIAACAEGGRDWKDAVRVFSKMWEGNVIAYKVISACGSQGWQHGWDLA